MHARIAWCLISISLTRLAVVALDAHVAGLCGEDRVLEHRLVELEADLADVPRLLVAEQVAGAADVEVVAGEVEAGAEAVEIGEHFQALLRCFSDGAVLRHG